MKSKKICRIISFVSPSKLTSTPPQAIFPSLLIGTASWNHCWEIARWKKKLFFFNVLFSVSGGDSSSSRQKASECGCRLKWGPGWSEHTQREWGFLDFCPEATCVFSIARALIISAGWPQILAPGPGAVADFWSLSNQSLFYCCYSGPSLFLLFTVWTPFKPITC